MRVVDILGDLSARGLVQSSTDLGALAARLSSPTTLYHGIDPTADSLHIGNLVGILVLRRFQDAGHRPIALAGGATGMIGDPGGKSEERNLLEPEGLAINLSGIKSQLESLLDFEGSKGALLVDNAVWTMDLTLLEFLRGVGKHVTVNAMVAKESVRSRMEGTEGISFTEFSYMLLQANDYAWLHAHEGCDLQIGGSDQWGNIALGVDYVRRLTGDSVHGLTWPLLTRADGRKFGKSEAGNVWLAAHRTSPYQFFQYWMQVPDADVRRYLLQLTLLPVAEVEAVASSHEAHPEGREAQRRLAREVTTLVHGASAAATAEAASAILFGSAPSTWSEEALSTLEDEVGTTLLSPDRLRVGLELVELLVETGLAASRSDAARSLDQGGIYVNNRRALPGRLGEADLLASGYLLLRRGKHNYHLVIARAG